MADETPSPDSSTRWLETSRGILRYSELAPLLAERVLRIQERIETDGYADRPLNEDFHFFLGVCGFALHEGVPLSP